jgi:hypothetical protein
MTVKTNPKRLRIVFFVLLFAMILLPFNMVFAQGTAGITLEKDVAVDVPINGSEDLPDELTFSLYGSEGSVDVLASQTFKRGSYTLDYDFSKSDGLASGQIARVKANFTNKLDLGSDTETPKQPEELWMELSVGDTVLGNRTRVPDEAMVQLLLASDASIVTYLTLAYDGDGNPITTIYKALPISSVAGGSGPSLSEYFSTVAITGDAVINADTRAANWVDSGANVYTLGKVGIKNTAPDRDVSVKYSSSSGGLNNLPTISVANTNTTPGEYSFSSFEFSASDGAVVGEFFADGSGLFLGGNPNVYFRASTNHPILLGTNKTVRMILTNTGEVGIGTTNPGAYKLAVNGSIGCKELTVTNTGWADFVFESGYRLPPLEEVENFISINRHLPGIPTEAEVKENGVSIGDISSKLLQKIEELTLYVIELKKENERLRGDFADIQAQFDKK